MQVYEQWLYVFIYVRKRQRGNYLEACNAALKCIVNVSPLEIAP